jgi:mRNA-degrading endonuclease YafQ of YafQ-DinJ toxin-antitoxin module
MAYSLVFTESYLRRVVILLRRHPELRKPYAKTLALLETNPHHPSLRLHALSGRLTGVYSVSINLSYRITLAVDSRPDHRAHQRGRPRHRLLMPITPHA